MKTPFPQLTLSMSTDASPRSRVSTMNQIITLILAQCHIFILVHFLLHTFHLEDNLPVIKIFQRMENLNGLHILLPKVGAECPAGPVLSAGAQVVPCVRKLEAD